MTNQNSYTWLRKHQLLGYFVLANVFSWLIWLPLLIDVQSSGQGDGPLWWLHYLGGFGPLLASVTMTAVIAGWRGIAQLGRSIAGVGAPKKWLLLAVALPFLFFAVAAVIGGLVTGQWVHPSSLLASDKLPGISFVSFVLIELVAFGVGEETGWRGYGLPRLQARFNPLASAAILTLPWAFWHLPTFFYNTNMMNMGIGGTIGWLLSLLTGSFILSWLFNNSKGSVLAVALFHGLIDVVFVSQAVAGTLDTYVGMVITLFACALIVPLLRAKRAIVAK
jgi:membrane protease YdiL (CAAX protease family)